ncbi:Chitin synthase, class 2 [Entophlyctis luteolus]|nr:Chitin synthase, class 2 [Entophlyctis luteolus]
MDPNRRPNNLPPRRQNTGELQSIRSNDSSMTSGYSQYQQQAPQQQYSRPPPAQYPQQYQQSQSQGYQPQQQPQYVSASQQYYSAPAPVPAGNPYSDQVPMVQYGQQMGTATPPPAGQHNYPPDGSVPYQASQPLYAPIMIPVNVPPPDMMMHINNIQVDQSILRTATRRVVKQVELTQEGHLVLDIPVPDRVLQLGQFKTGDEFTTMRYTAVTCDPDHFAEDGYALRQQEMKRRTEIFIVVTMYNEGDDLFCKTMVALFKNISYLCKRSRSTTWGEKGWQKVVICVVSDGRTKIHPRVLNVLGLMGVYQDGIMKNKVGEEDVTAHVFEYTTQLCIDPDMNISGAQQGIVPVQVLFCLKEKNAKKINSHRWFFNAFGQVLRPNVCVLIDVGTKPTESSVYHLWKAFDKNPMIGGACGEIYAELGYGWTKLLNPLVAAQNFEYKMSNILDKPLESSFGFIAVLPGAFSAYRYAALQGVPLQQYFKGETMHGGNNIFQANMYLAEDRILCFELVTKAKGRWLLRYVRAAKAETDVPDNVAEFISQRRRWLNGSFFATLHALLNWSLIFRSDHSVFRKIAFCVEFLYNFISLAFSWTGLANFFLAFYFMMDTSNPVVLQQYDSSGNVISTAPVVYALGPTGSCTPKQLAAGTTGCTFSVNQLLSTIFMDFYVVSLVVVFVVSLGNRPQGSKITYTVCMVLFALIMCCLLYLGGFSIYAVVVYSLAQLNASGKTGAWNIVVFLFELSLFRDIVLSLASTYVLYLVSSFLYFEPWHVFTSMLQYLMLLPSYVNILNVYSFCNLHDVSWGTKGDNVAGGDLGVAKTNKKEDGKSAVEVEVPSDRQDINTGYDKHIVSLKAPRENEKKKRDAKTKQEDYFKNFRTKVVVSWLFTNGILVGVLTTTWIKNYLYALMNLHGDVGMTADSSVNPYLKFIFYANLGLAGVRFLGSMYYSLTKPHFVNRQNIAILPSLVNAATSPSMFVGFEELYVSNEDFYKRAIIDGICRPHDGSPIRPDFNTAMAKFLLHCAALAYEEKEVVEHYAAGLEMSVEFIEANHSRVTIFVSVPSNFIIVVFTGYGMFDFPEFLVTTAGPRKIGHSEFLPGNVHETFSNQLDFSERERQHIDPQSPHKLSIHSDFWKTLDTEVFPKFSAQTVTSGSSQRSYPNVWFTGHSVGAALATLILSHLAVTNHPLVSLKILKGCYTFGSPKCGDTEFARFTSEALTDNQVNANDVIPAFPLGTTASPSFKGLELDYKHVGIPVVLNYDATPFDVGKSRDLECTIKNAVWFFGVRLPAAIAHAVVISLTPRTTGSHACSSVLGALQALWPFPWEHMPAEYGKRLKH